ncbi:MAG: helix-turn-helix transcriptional regulator, partial [Burkholderiales bacterium]|nr:helix-turn-helix transcriptional regulator [Opitutaceae bacterium]
WLSDACAAIQEPRHFVGGTPALARLAGRSPEHLAREMRRHLRRTPTDVVNAARLTHAAQQLATTSRPIIDIAGECGFEGLGHFYKLFHARYATSPLRYRRHAVAPMDISYGRAMAR